MKSFLLLYLHLGREKRRRGVHQLFRRFVGGRAVLGKHHHPACGVALAENGGKIPHRLSRSFRGADGSAVRVPLIPELNTEADREATRTLLAEMGVEKMDFFTYKR